VGAKLSIENVDEDGGTRVECTLPPGAVARERSHELRPTSSPLPMARPVPAAERPVSAKVPTAARKDGTSET
jgi:hypothetical protein